MSDKRDLYPELPVGLLVGKRDAEAQYLVLDFLTHRPAGEQWAYALQIFEGIRESNPRTSSASVYVNCHRLAEAEYLERKLEPLPPRPSPADRQATSFERLIGKFINKFFPEGPGPRMRTYYRATADGTRAYNNSKKAALRQPLPMPKQKPAPVLG